MRKEAIQPNSAKTIIVDQRKIFLTNKEAFVVHRHCPKCNNSTMTKDAIILSRPGRPGSAKRHNSNLTWIYQKNILSFCPNCQIFYVDEADVDSINLKASRACDQYRNIRFLQPENINVFENHEKQIYMLKGIPDFKRNTVPDLSDTYFDLSDEAKLWVYNWYYPSTDGRNLFSEVSNEHLNKLLQERKGHVIKYRGIIQSLEHCSRSVCTSAQKWPRFHKDWLNYIHRFSGTRCVYQRNAKATSSSVFVQVYIEAEPYGERILKLDVYEEIMQIIYYQRMSPKLIKSLKRNVGTSVDVYICENQEILFDVTQLLSLNYGYLY